MKPFHLFEEEILRLLTTPVLGATSVEIIVFSAELVNYEYSGVGYFVTVKHSVLPAAQIVISKPIVIGTVGKVQGGYLVFIKNGELMLECYSASPIEVPANFRDLRVHVSVGSNS